MHTVPILYLLNLLLNLKYCIFYSETSSEEFKKWLKDQEDLENFKLEEIQRQNIIENEKWLNADRIAVAHWKKIQEKLELSRLKNLEEEIRIQMVNNKLITFIIHIT